MQQLYFVARQGQQQGPFSLDEIHRRVHGKELQLHDYIYDEVQKDWVLLVAFAPLMEKIKSSQPGELAQFVQADTSREIPGFNENETPWYVLKGENKFGPFAYVELVRMLQEKSLFEWDYIWQPEYPNWLRVADIKEFSKAEIKRLHVQASEQSGKEIFFRRRHARAKYGASLIVHNKKEVWRGQSFEISAGGAGITIEHTKLHPGEKIYIHFKPGDGVPPFNAECEIVSKQFSSGLGKATTVHYGVRFVNANMQLKRTLDEYAVRKTRAA